MSVKHIEYLKVHNSKLLIAEIRPVKCLVDSPLGPSHTDKWMERSHWQDLYKILMDIVDDYEKETTSGVITYNLPKYKNGTTIQIGYMFRRVPSCSCSAYFLAPRGSSIWKEDDTKKLNDKGGRYKAFMLCTEMLVVSVSMGSPAEEKDPSPSQSSSTSYQQFQLRCKKKLTKALDNKVEITSFISDYFTSPSPANKNDSSKSGPDTRLKSPVLNCSSKEEKRERSNADQNMNGGQCSGSVDPSILSDQNPEVQTIENYYSDADCGSDTEVKEGVISKPMASKTEVVDSVLTKKTENAKKLKNNSRNIHIDCNGKLESKIKGKTMCNVKNEEEDLYFEVEKEMDLDPEKHKYESFCNSDSQEDPEKHKYESFCNSDSQESSQGDLLNVTNFCADEGRIFTSRTVQYSFYKSSTPNLLEQKYFKENVMNDADLISSITGRGMGRGEDNNLFPMETTVKLEAEDYETTQKTSEEWEEGRPTKIKKRLPGKLSPVNAGSSSCVKGNALACDLLIPIENSVTGAHVLQDSHSFMEESCVNEEVDIVDENDRNVGNQEKEIESLFTSECDRGEMSTEDVIRELLLPDEKNNMTNIDTNEMRYVNNPQNFQYVDGIQSHELKRNSEDARSQVQYSYTKFSETQLLRKDQESTEVHQLDSDHSLSQERKEVELDSDSDFRNSWERTNYDNVNQNSVSESWMKDCCSHIRKYDYQVEDSHIFEELNSLVGNEEHIVKKEEIQQEVQPLTMENEESTAERDKLQQSQILADYFRFRNQNSDDMLDNSSVLSECSEKQASSQDRSSTKTSTEYTNQDSTDVDVEIMNSSDCVRSLESDVNPQSPPSVDSSMNIDVEGSSECESYQINTRKKSQVKLLRSLRFSNNKSNIIESRRDKNGKKSESVSKDLTENFERRKKKMKATKSEIEINTHSKLLDSTGRDNLMEGNSKAEIDSNFSKDRGKSPCDSVQCISSPKKDILDKYVSKNKKIKVMTRNSKRVIYTRNKNLKVKRLRTNDNSDIKEYKEADGYKPTAKKNVQKSDYSLEVASDSFMNRSTFTIEDNSLTQDLEGSGSQKLPQEDVCLALDKSSNTSEDFNSLSNESSRSEELEESNVRRSKRLKIRQCNLGTMFSTFQEDMVFENSMDSNFSFSDEEYLPKTPKKCSPKSSEKNNTTSNTLKQPKIMDFMSVQPENSHREVKDLANNKRSLKDSCVSDQETSQKPNSKKLISKDHISGSTGKGSDDFWNFSLPEQSDKKKKEEKRDKFKFRKITFCSKQVTKKLKTKKSQESLEPNTEKNTSDGIDDDLYWLIRAESEKLRALEETTKKTSEKGRRKPKDDLCVLYEKTEETSMELKSLRNSYKQLQSMTNSELERRLDDNIPYLEDVMRGVVPNERHEMYKLSKTKLKLQNDYIIYGVFSIDQSLYVLNLLKKKLGHMDKLIGNMYDILSYRCRVLVPTFFTKLVMENEKVDMNKALQLMSQFTFNKDIAED